MLFFSRGLSGMGAGGINALVLIIVGDLTSTMKDSRRRKCQACLETLVVIGNGLGPVIAGAVAERASWRWTFWLLVPMTVICGVFVAVLMPGVEIEGDWKEKMMDIDYIGTLTSIGAVLLILVSTVKYAVYIIELLLTNWFYRSLSAMVVYSILGHPQLSLPCWSLLASFWVCSSSLNGATPSTQSCLRGSCACYLCRSSWGTTFSWESSISKTFSSSPSTFKAYLGYLLSSLASWFFRWCSLFPLELPQQV